jgi:hypothetical protein
MEAHMKHMVTYLEGTDEPIQFIQSIKSNSFLEAKVGSYTLEELNFETRTICTPLHRD